MPSFPCAFSLLINLLRLAFLSALAVSTGTAIAQPTGDAAAEAADRRKIALETKPAIENSVVKVFAAVRYPEPFRPWAKQAPQEVTGSGVVIEGRRILTNAHVVLYAGQVQVQANQSGDKIGATVIAIAPGVDLAVLKLDDETFFDQRPPVARTSILPDIKEPVMAYGFPTGGTSLSITKGIVSRIEFAVYNLLASGLRIQIDAAINPGNSGGPAIAGDKMIGIAFSQLGGAQNIGYIIPNEEIDLFLGDVADGRYDGKPAIFDETQRMQNPALRGFLGLEKTTHGVIVRVPFDDAPSYPLKKWDVITQIGDADIDDEGMIKIGDNLRVRFEYFVQKLAREGTVPITFIRGGNVQKVDLPVSAHRPMLIPDLAGAYPQYFVYGPIVLSAATAQLIASINRDSIDGIISMGHPLVTRRGDKPEFAGEQLVVVSAPFFPHRLAQGFWPPVGWAIEAVDGIRIKNLRHLVEVLRDGTSAFVVFDFYGRGTESFAFPRQEMLAATDEILSDNGVRSQGSPELLAVWTEKTAGLAGR